METPRGTGHAQVLFLTLVDRGLIETRPGTLSSVTVLHDDHCPCVAQNVCGGVCNCDPGIEIRGKTYRYSEIMKQ